MTEREKIIKIIAPYVAAYGEDEAIADALIAARIGDVSEWKRRAEVAERNDKLNEKALNNACAMLYAQGVESPFSDEDWHLLQAEKELTEGKKDD